MACIFYEMPYVFSHIGKECAYNGYCMQNLRIRMRRSPCVSREIYFFMISLLTGMQCESFISPIIWHCANNLCNPIFQECLL